MPDIKFPVLSLLNGNRTFESLELYKNSTEQFKKGAVLKLYLLRNIVLRYSASKHMKKKFKKKIPQLFQNH